MLKSKKKDHPKISKKIIALIQQINKDNPLLSPKKIHEKLVDLSISNVPAPNTIAKYIMATRKPPTEEQSQSWKTFLLNHSKDIWAMDFFVVPMLHLIFYMFFLLGINKNFIRQFFSENIDGLTNFQKKLTSLFFDSALCLIPSLNNVKHSIDVNPGANFAALILACTSFKARFFGITFKFSSHT